MKAPGQNDIRAPTARVRDLAWAIYICASQLADEMLHVYGR